MVVQRIYESGTACLWICKTFAGMPMGKFRNSMTSRTLVKADENSVYGVLVRQLSPTVFETYCSDAKIRHGTIRGSMIRRVWMRSGDIVLCSLRDDRGKYCNIEIKYTPDEVKVLREGGYITDELLNLQSNKNIQVEIDRL